MKIENIYLLSNAPRILVIVQTYLNTTKFTCLVNKRKLRLEFVVFEKETSFIISFDRVKLTFLAKTLSLLYFWFCKEQKYIFFRIFPNSLTAFFM